MTKLHFEQTYFHQGIRCLAGIDEAGRGPLAGPVVAAAAVITSDWQPSQQLATVRDSKSLSAKQRAYLYQALINELPGYGVALVDHQEIDQLNILQATLKAMRLAVTAATLPPELLLIDGNQALPDCMLAQQTVVKGDSLAFSIAAASILAKESRDRLMDEYHQLYPVYGFDRHRGYGTKAHLAAIATHGPCPIHRLSFAPLKPI